MRRARHDTSAHPCGHRSRKRPGQAGGRTRRPRALSRPGHRANRRFPPERCHALPRRSRPTRCGGPQRRRSGRRIDPLEIDRDPKGQLDGIFAIAARHGVGLDIHLHEPGEMGLFNVQEICIRTNELGLGGRVTISHGFCLGGITERKAAEAAAMMAEAGVALVTHGAGGLTMPPIEMLRAAGVLVFAGNDDIRDTWSPYGTGDLLERAAIIGWKGDFRRDAEVEVAFDLVSTAGAQALGIGDYGVRVGAAANLFTIAASCVPEAVAAHPPRKLVLFDGKVVARDGSFLATPISITAEA